MENKKTAGISEKETSERFEMPEIELVKFNAADVITTSGEPEEPDFFGSMCIAA